MRPPRLHALADNEHSLILPRHKYAGSSRLPWRAGLIGHWSALGTFPVTMITMSQEGITASALYIGHAEATMSRPTTRRRVYARRRVLAASMGFD